jgi:hypothetical protein
MNYINTETKTEHSEADIRALYPLTSFTHPFVPPEGFAVVFPAPPPAYDAITQFAREIAPELTAKGHYEQRWEVVELFATQPERDAALAADAESKRIAAVPSSVSPRQIRQALTRAWLRAAVEAAVAAGDQDLKDWWEFSTAFERSNQHVIDMGSTLGVTARQLDDLWTLARSL